MFFGKGGGVEEVSAGSLQRLSDSCFDKKMSKLDSRAAAIASGLSAAIQEFRSACTSFMELDAEPYTEDLWMPNINSIKKQKQQYASALMGIADECSLIVSPLPVAYERYMAILSSISELSGRVLRTNATFKQAFYCYSKHLGAFKKTMAQIDRLSSSLKSELDSHSADYNSYLDAGRKISQLSAYVQELASLEKDIGAIGKPGTVPADNFEKANAFAAESLARKREELNDISGKISETSKKINSLTAPLERASKKFDHMTLGRKPLSRFLLDPINTLSSESEYAEFKSLMADFSKALMSGSIDLKNAEYVAAAASELEESGIYESIEMLKSLKSKKSETESEIRSLENEIGLISSAKRKVTDAAQEADALKSKSVSVSKSMNELKGQIEAAFEANYGKRIRIIL